MSQYPEIRALILAAGKGTRMQSDLPKVLHQLQGKALIEHIINSVKKLNPQGIGVVVSPGIKDDLRGVLGDEFELIVQDGQKGTGHAVLAAADWCADFDGDLLVLVGDAPLIRSATLQKLRTEQRLQKRGVTFATAVFDDPPPWGRVLRDADGAVFGIVEEKDASSAEKEIKEVSSSHYCFNIGDLYHALPKIDRNNKQGEYYLPDVIGLMINKGLPVHTITVDDPMEVFGINTPDDVHRVEGYLRRKITK